MKHETAVTDTQTDTLPLTQISRSHFSTLNISETIQVRTTVTIERQ